MLVTLTVLSFGSSSPSLRVATVDCRPAAERRDCFPWTENATAEACLARGCLWCDDDDTNDASLHPSCFYDDEVCPSVIDESLRDECPLTAFNRTDCQRNGCIWCANTTNSGNLFSRLLVYFQYDSHYQTTIELNSTIITGT